jgi:hypothetical protein
VANNQPTKKENKMIIRKYTDKLLEMLDEGLVSHEYVAKACIQYMSDADVEDMMRCNDILFYDDE